MTEWKSVLYIELALKGISVVAAFGEGFIDGMTLPVPQFLYCKLLCVSRKAGALLLIDLLFITSFHAFPVAISFPH